jgi:phosphohistidine phosphatase SixA
VLRDAGVQRVFSTDYRRTRLTADPLATELGVSVEAFDPRDLSAFAEQLKAMTGARVVVVGHSNTTPELVGLLGGDSVRQMPEWEYDRLYVVGIEPTGAVRSLLLRYGASSAEPVEATH